MSTKPYILAVDDDTDLLALMARALGADYDVVTVSDPGDAITKAFEDRKPDLILLDVEMPGASGFEVCSALKAEAPTAGIPIIFLTGKNEPKDQAEGFELGAVDYITKPINAAVLRARVRTHVALANQRLELEKLVQERTAQLEHTRTQLIRRLARAMEMHESAAVGNRVMRLAQYAKLIAQAAGANAQIAEAMSVAAPLHDVGKLGVPAEILGRPRSCRRPTGSASSATRSSAPRSSASTTTRCSSSRARSRCATTSTGTAPATRRAWPARPFRGPGAPWPSWMPSSR
jgi:putative two-component system response regulator